MSSAKEELIEYILEKFAKLESQYQEALSMNRETSILMIQGGMFELGELYKRLTGSDDLNERIAFVFRRIPVPKDTK